MSTCFSWRWSSVFAITLAGCAASSFQPQFRPTLAPTPEAMARPALTPKPRQERAVAVGITQDPMRLCAWDLNAGLLWERPVVAKSAPLVVGSAIVMQEAEGVVVRDLATGQVRTIVDDKGHLVGADAEDDSVVVSVAYDTPNPRGAIAYIAGNHVRWKQPLNLPVGSPAIANDQVVVPWATQRLSILAGADGKELARFHFKSSVLGHAIVDRGRLYVGQLGLLPVTEQLLAHPEAKLEPYTPRKRELAGQPALLRDGYEPVPEPDSAHHRLELDWHLAQGKELATENDALWLRFYRLLFALDAREDRVRWVRAYDHDLVGFAIVPGGVIFVDDAGILRVLDPSGTELTNRDLDRKLRVIAIRPAGQLPASVVTAAAPTVAAADPEKALRAELFAAASLDDDRLSAARAYAIEQLSGFNASDVTANLLALCSNGKSPEPVHLAACSHLAERDSGGTEVIEALRQHASFLENTPAPPVGALAEAAAKMQLTKAGPLILSQVEDPNTPAHDLAQAFHALERLNMRGATPDIERFVRLHHAEPAGSELAPAIAAALHALGALKARAQRDTLLAVSQDAFTVAAVREQARQAIVAIDAVPAPKTESVAKEESEEDDEVQTDPRPYSLTAAVVRSALMPVQAELSRCLASDATHPRTGRVSMVIDGAGGVEGIFVAPTSLAPCVEPILRRAKFPPTRLGRQRVTHSFHGPNATRTVKPKQAKAATTKPTKPTKPPTAAGAGPISQR